MIFLKCVPHPTLIRCTRLKYDSLLLQLRFLSDTCGRSHSFWFWASFGTHKHELMSIQTSGRANLEHWRGRSGTFIKSFTPTGDSTLWAWLLGERHLVHGEDFGCRWRLRKDIGAEELVMRLCFDTAILLWGSTAYLKLIIDEAARWWLRLRNQAVATDGHVVAYRAWLLLYVNITCLGSQLPAI